MQSLSLTKPPLRRIRSFARRDSRITEGQAQAFQKHWPTLGLFADAGLIDFATVFGRSAPTILEIGFGSGQSLSTLACQYPHYNFIGIETFRPGIGALFAQVENLALENVRVFYVDAVDVLEKCIPAGSLDGLQIFFPDPWPKRRHHKRRLIQPAFVSLAATKLKPAGVLHLATDWEDYAKQMMKVLSAESQLENLAGKTQYAERSSFRPIVTKFEDRGEKEGRPIWELQFAKL